MDLMNPHRVGGTNDSGNVMRLMHLLHADGKVVLAQGQHFLDTSKALRIHALVTVAVNFDHIRHHTNLTHDIRQVDAIACGQTDKGTVNAAIALFGIQTLDIGTGSINGCREISQCTLVVKHIHLDLSHKLLFGDFIPLYRHEFFWLFLVAANISTGFMVNNQAFTGADVSDNGIARNRATAFRKGNQHTVCTFDGQLALFFVIAERAGVGLEQVLGHDHAHCITQTDFR
ncbi:hypothetical protein PAJ_3142 [Pantoea ananatis AJ13355]|uniref:Uncharacterized protein n=1 Tax=Pantoea ananatis (strain AJ13355) TaxID=932677 RepID=A0A0H3L1C3_PANAA|nr:hypothetical protein PAJ_3142 [Pantoea ananatis AJ13355]